MSLDELITDEFLERIREDYNIKSSTTVKYAKRILSNYPYVCNDKEAFEETVEEVVSSLSALSEEIYNKDNHASIIEKNAEYDRNVLRVIRRAVKNNFIYEMTDNEKYQYVKNMYDDEYVTDTYSNRM